MSDDATVNTITSDGRARSRARGDVPDDLRRRYFLDGRGGAGIGYYADARIANPAFRDTGGRLAATRSDPNVIRDLVAIAKHRDWTAIVVRGDADFRREAWLAARTIDIAVAGYRPTARDLQDLERRTTAQARRAERQAASPQVAQTRRGDPAATLRTVETVVRTRVTSPRVQEQILQAARLRIAGWLEHGAERQLSVDTAQGARRERQRTR